MLRRNRIQREWLTEDLAQIERYFPGAEVIETLDTPFDLTASRRNRARAVSSKAEIEHKYHGHVARIAACAVSDRVQVACHPARSTGASEQRADECGLTMSEAISLPEEKQASLPKIDVFLVTPGGLL